MRSTVLHLAKIAGISGAETHLLSLLPRLRERDWDVRLLQLHENEPGAFEFADELRDRGVPVDMIRLRADVDPLAFTRVAALPRPLAAADPAHAPRPRGRLRPGRRRGGARSRCG